MDSNKDVAEDLGSSHCSHAAPSEEWTEVSDFGDIHNLYAAMDFATGDRMERFIVRGGESVKLYTMVYRVDNKWFSTAFRIATLLHKRVFEIQTIEIVCGTWLQTNESKAIQRRLVGFLGT